MMVKEMKNSYIFKGQLQGGRCDCELPKSGRWMVYGNCATNIVMGNVTGQLCGESGTTNWDVPCQINDEWTKTKMRTIEK
jgi:hypothetical protein